MPKKYSILMLLDAFNGECTELKEFDHVIEAPFFLNEHELLYNSNGRIFRFDLNTSSIFEVHTGCCCSCNNDHVLSPDKKLLAVSNNDDGIGSRIYIVHLDNSVPPRLVTPLAPSYLHGWSPYGSTLAYCASRNGDYDVYTISAHGDSEAETRLTDAPGLDDGPEYSPDGKYIYFNSVRDGFMDCFRMNADGTNQIRLTNNGRNNWFPHISPDNQTIAYISYDPKEVAAGNHPADKNVEIRRMDPDGGNDKTLLAFFGGQGSLNVNSWMPDSRHLAFVKYEYR